MTKVWGSLSSRVALATERRLRCTKPPVRGERNARAKRSPDFSPAQPPACGERNARGPPTMLLGSKYVGADVGAVQQPQEARGPPNVLLGSKYVGGVG